MLLFLLLLILSTFTIKDQMFLTKRFRVDHISEFFCNHFAFALLLLIHELAADTECIGGQVGSLLGMGGRDCRVFCLFLGHH